MTYEEATNAANCSPFDEIYAWCYRPRMGMQAERTHFMYAVRLDQPTEYMAFGIVADKATLEQLELYLRTEPWRQGGVPPDSLELQWFTGTPADLLRQVKQRGHYDI